MYAQGANVHKNNKLPSALRTTLVFELATCVSPDLSVLYPLPKSLLLLANLKSIAEGASTYSSVAITLHALS
jgi:hypothetical protein